MMAKLMNGTYYEIIGGMEDDIIENVNSTNLNDDTARETSAQTERVCYKNTYKDGKRIESVKLYDPYNDEMFMVGHDTVYYEPLPKDKAFEYSMLGRLKSDCDYFLGNGDGYEPHLWADTVEKQIAEMKRRWLEFDEDEKPEWLTMEDIENYERRMLEIKESRKKVKKTNRDPYKENILIHILKEMNEDEYFHTQVVADGKKFIAPINLDEGAIRELIKYYGG